MLSKIYLVVTVLSLFICISARECECSDSVWVYSKPGAYNMSGKEIKAAAFIANNQLQQIREIGTTSKEAVNGDWYLIKGKPNDVYFTSYMLKSGELYFLFLYAVDLVSGRIIYADYHAFKSLDRFKGITYWPLSKIEDYDISDYKRSQQREDLTVGAYASKDIAEDRAIDVFLIMHLCATELSKYKNIDVTISPLVKAFFDIYELILPGKYKGTMEETNLAFEISMKKAAADKYLLEVFVTEIKTDSSKKTKLDMVEIKAAKDPQHVQDIAKRLSEKMLRMAEQIKPESKDLEPIVKGTPVKGKGSS